MFLASPSSQYDRGVNTFSPEGRLFQVEYALEAIKLGSTAIGIQAKDGVVLAVERRIASPLLIPSSIQKMFEIDSHMAAAASGLSGDAQTLVERARSIAINHTFVYDEPIKTESLAQSVSDLALRFGDIGEGSKMARPFGVAMLFAGYDETGAKLFVTDPSGTYMQYQAKAIGGAGEAAQVELVEKYKEDLTKEQAMTMALDILKQVMEEKMSSINIQVCMVDCNGYHLLNESEVEAELSKL